MTPEAQKLFAFARENAYRQFGRTPMRERTPEQRRDDDLTDLLVRVSEFLDNYVDGIIGDYGEPRPNKAMRLKGDVDRELERRSAQELREQEQAQRELESRR